jgi:uncharacterized protein YcgL (UPF0745 family)
MYLYLPYKEQAILLDLPEELKKLTGGLQKVMELELTSDRRLARAKVSDVIVSLREKGFYLQMPPNNLIRNDSSMLNDDSDSL